MKHKVTNRSLVRHEKAHHKHNKMHKLVASILAFIVVAHLFRAIALWNVTIQGIIVPIWFSWVIVGIGLILIYFLYKDF